MIVHIPFWPQPEAHSGRGTCIRMYLPSTYVICEAICMHLLNARNNITAAASEFQKPIRITTNMQFCRSLDNRMPKSRKQYHTPPAEGVGGFVSVSVTCIALSVRQHRPKQCYPEVPRCMHRSYNWRFTCSSSLASVLPLFPHLVVFVSKTHMSWPLSIGAPPSFQ